MSLQQNSSCSFRVDEQLFVFTSLLLKRAEKLLLVLMFL